MPDLSFITPKVLLTIFHLIGVVFGAGGAAASDLMFFKSIRDHQISKAEEGFLRLGSTMVWGGLALLLLSGLGLYSLDPIYYLQSDKFFAKMLIVGILTLNGLVFHVSHLPWLQRHTDMPLRNGAGFARRAPLLILAGVISATSWTAALVLGSLREVPMTFQQIMTVYGAILVINAIIGLALKNRILCIPGCVCTTDGCVHTPKKR